MADTPECPRCKGTGDAGYMKPVKIADNLTESDARLLVFGTALVQAALTALRGLDLAHYPIYQLLRDVLSKVKGTSEAE